MRPLHLAALISLLSTPAYADNTNATFGSTPTATVVEVVDTNPMNLTTTTTYNTDNGVTSSTTPLGKTRTINISTSDRFGTIEESLTPAIHAETRYVSRAGNSYLLVGTGQQQANEQKEQLMIPSWKVFSW